MSIETTTCNELVSWVARPPLKGRFEMSGTSDQKCGRLAAASPIIDLEQQ